MYREVKVPEYVLFLEYFKLMQGPVHMNVTLRSHDDLLSWVNFIAPGQVHRHLITTNLSEFL